MYVRTAILTSHRYSRHCHGRSKAQSGNRLFRHVYSLGAKINDFDFQAGEGTRGIVTMVLASLHPRRIYTSKLSYKLYLFKNDF